MREVFMKMLKGLCEKISIRILNILGTLTYSNFAFEIASLKHLTFSIELEGANANKYDFNDIISRLGNPQVEGKTDNGVYYIGYGTEDQNLIFNSHNKSNVSSIEYLLWSAIQ
ncbi:hypothetical protein [Bacillus sp. FJAT-45350]|uniref:hypothetical protein n=1 Tax=Bacillus sp. FJAT-45350 TaxID=2011014 RepID=UPI0015CD0280|nr:hypothetical protein [Bacillus sp. FJAT-45350]